MWKYLKQAFWFRPAIPGLGGMPVNLLGLAAFGILGFAEPALWLLGLGLETAYLFWLAHHPGFREYVDTAELGGILTLPQNTQEAKRQELVQALPGACRRRLRKLEKLCADALDTMRARKRDAMAIDNTAQALRRLAWSYLKLLMAQAEYERLDDVSDAKELAEQITDLERDLDSKGLSAAAREAKQETLEILRRRLGNLRQRSVALQEIASDLQRIEAQIGLIRESAAMPDGAPATAADIAVAKFYLDETFTPRAERDIAELDAAYGAAATVDDAAHEQAESPAAENRLCRPHAAEDTA